MSSGSSLKDRASTLAAPSRSGSNLLTLNHKASPAHTAVEISSGDDSDVEEVIAASRKTSKPTSISSASENGEDVAVIPAAAFYNDPGQIIGGRTMRTRTNIPKPARIYEEPTPEPSRRKRPTRAEKRASERATKREARASGPRRETLSRGAKDKRPVFKDTSSSEEEDSESESGEYSEDDEAQTPVKRQARKPAARSSRKSTGRDDENDMSRAELRAEITKEATRKRNIFLLKNREFIEPLLTEKNYITKLAEITEDDDDELSKDVIPNPDDDVTPYKKLDQQPEKVTATMKPYQLSGLSYLVYLNANGLSGILGDEMGLGKTLQTLSLFSHLTTTQPPGKDRPHRPFLVICPLSVLGSWVNECKKFTPHLRAMRLHGPVKERNRLKDLAERGMESGKDGSEHRVHPDEPQRGWDIIVTSYDMFVAEKVWFRRAFIWRYAVLDEGHAIKNSETLAAQALHSIGAEYRLILTGTPLQNNLLELWSLFHWLYPEVFTVKTGEKWKEAFDLTKGKVDSTFMDHSRKLLELVMLRRMKDSPGVNLGLPPKEEVLLHVPLSPLQRMWYKTILTKLDQGMLDELFKGAKDKELAEISDESRGESKAMAKLEIKVDMDGNDASASADGDSTDAWKEAEEAVKSSLAQAKGDARWRKLMNLLMQLRKICNHPYLIPAAEPEPYILGQHIITASGKFILLEKLVGELVIKQGRKILMFSNFTKTLDICEDFLALMGGDGEKFKYLRLDGSTARGRRNLNIRLFNNSPEYKVFLISTKAGGLGINLTSASEVIMIDAHWNPQVDLQAEARSHRIGQKNKVTIYRLITQGTVEEQMMGRIQKKLYLSAKVTESMRDIHNTANVAQPAKTVGRPAEEDDMPSMSTGQLMTLVRRGATAIARPEIDPKEMLSWDWDRMYKECKDYHVIDYDSVAEKDNEATEAAEAEWLNTVEKVETRIFEGKAHAKAALAASKNKEFSRQDRREGKNRTVMIDGYEVLKETVGNADWEAVATFAGKDPRLAEPVKRKKRTVTNQSHCQVCFDGGDIVCCSGCPRSYHYDCLEKEMQVKTKGKMNFFCSQHECHDCLQKTGEAGGMLFRCRWCEHSYCDDCLDYDAANLLGEQLLEYELLEFPAIPQAFYIECPDCVEHHNENVTAKKFCDNMIKEYEEEWNDKVRAAEDAEREEQERHDHELALQLNPRQTKTIRTPVKPKSKFKSDATPSASDSDVQSAPMTEPKSKRKYEKKIKPETPVVDASGKKQASISNFFKRPAGATPKSVKKENTSPAVPLSTTGKRKIIGISTGDLSKGSPRSAKKAKK